jgi:hypothetical protein
MSCNLLDLACHAQSAAWEWWAGVGGLNKALIIIGLAAIVLGIAWSWGAMLKRIGGWPAVIGAIVLAVGLVLAVIMPKKPSDDLVSENVDGPDAEPSPKHRKPKPPFQFGVDRDKPKRKTLKDLISFGT